MNLGDYFDNTKGYGVIATADSEGKVNAAVYARPHFFDEKTIAFIMRERLTHANLQTNTRCRHESPTSLCGETDGVWRLDA